MLDITEDLGFRPRSPKRDRAQPGDFPGPVMQAILSGTRISLLPPGKSRLSAFLQNGHSPDF